MDSQNAHDGVNKTLILTIICIGSFLPPFTLSAVNVAIPSMANELGGNSTLISWLPVIFLLSNASLMLPASKFADNHGYKLVFSMGLLTNTLGCILALFATSLEWVAFCRLIQGAGSAMTFGPGMAIIVSVFKSNRGFALGINGAAICIGMMLGPALGGILTNFFGWKSVFVLPIPLNILLFTVIAWRLKTEWKKDKYSAFDWTGSLIFTAAIICFAHGLSGAPSWPCMLELLAAFSLFALFVFHQARHSEPLLRVQLFRENPVFSCSLAATSLMYASAYPMTFVLSLYLQYVQGLDPFVSGQIIAMTPIGMAIMAPIAGKISDRYSPRITSTIGCLITSLGYIALTRLDATTDSAFISIALLLIGLGFGLFSSSNNNRVTSSVNRNEIGSVSASVNLARVFGNLTSISLVNLLFHMMIGRSSMSEEHFGNLLTTTQISITMMLCCVLLAAACCFVKDQKDKEGSVVAES